MDFSKRMAALGLFFSLALGCGDKGDRPGDAPRPAPKEAVPPVPVGGVIRLEGKPLPRVMVMFLPAREGEGRPASGITGADGTFDLGTSDPGDGAVPGRYKVVVMENAPAPPGGGEGGKPAPKARIPARYTDPEKTPLQCRVQAEDQKLVFDLKP